MPLSTTKYTRTQQRLYHRKASSLALQNEWEEENDDSERTHNPLRRHCQTCKCDDDQLNSQSNKLEPDSNATQATVYPCGSPLHENYFNHLLPPPQEPSYSVHKRVLPLQLTALNSPKGRQFLMEALSQQTAESYWPLMEQFINQSEPAFCGVTTLQMVLNAMCIDPNIRWRGGWRFYGSEEVLLGRCCLSTERIRRVGVTLEEFRNLAQCQGVSVQMRRPQISKLQLEEAKTNSGCNAATLPLRQVNRRQQLRADNYSSLEQFEADLRNVLTTPNAKALLVVSFSRSHLGQTGDGHFSPLAAYHEDSHQVLVLDVARFKYAPYWVPVQKLYEAMQPKDSATKRPRGWFVLNPPKHHKCLHQTHEDRRPAELVPVVGEPDVCPIGRIKVEFCPSNPERNN